MLIFFPQNTIEVNDFVMVEITYCGVLYFLPVLAKVRIVKSPDLKNIEILGVMPEKINIQYKVKSELEEKEKEKDTPEEVFYRNFFH